MTDTSSHDQEPGGTKRPPTSPIKRILAWIGLVYMVILVGLNTFFLFTGTMLSGLGGILLCPALLGLAILSLQGARMEEFPLGKWQGNTLAALCVAAFLLCLYFGIPGLLANFT